MSGLLGILDIGRRALFAQQAALNTVGNNIANVNTPGYTREETNLQADSVTVPGLGAVGTGVSVLGTDRARDALADAQVRRENQALGYWQAQSDQLSGLEALSNDVSSTGLASDLENFWAGWQALSDNPEDSLARDTVVEDAKTLADSMNRMADQYATTRRSLDSAIQDKITTLSNLAGQVADLNGRIVASHGQAPALSDQRDQLIDQMSKIVDVQVTQDDAGAMIVRMGGMILAGRSESLSLSMNKNAEVGTAARGPVWTETGQAADVRGGELAGLLRVRDTVLPDMQSRLDRLAYGVASEVNSLHMQGTDLKGIRGGAFFTLPARADDLDPSGSAAGIRVSAAVSADPSKVAAGEDGQAGDNRTALAIAGLRTSQIGSLGQVTPGDYWSAAAGHLGNEISTAKNLVDEHQTAADQSENLRQSVSGVSLDEEASKMVLYQQAYTAAAKLISVADQMFQVLLEQT